MRADGRGLWLELALPGRAMMGGGAAMRARGTRAAQVLTAGCIGYFALWACAPMTSGPPPNAVTAEHPRAVGGAATGTLLGALVVVRQDGAVRSRDIVLDPGASGEVWFAKRTGEGSYWYFRAGGGYPSLGHAGFGAHRRLNDPARRTSVGVSAEGGFLYLSLGLPIAVSVGDAGAVLYTRPSVGLRGVGIAQLPVGYAVPVGARGTLGLEANLHALSASGAISGVGGGVGGASLTATYTGRF